MEPSIQNDCFIFSNNLEGFIQLNEGHANRELRCLFAGRVGRMWALKLRGEGATGGGGQTTDAQRGGIRRAQLQGQARSLFCVQQEAE